MFGLLPFRRLSESKEVLVLGEHVLQGLRDNLVRRRVDEECLLGRSVCNRLVESDRGGDFIDGLDL